MSEQICTCGHPQSEHESLPHEEVHRDTRRVTTWFTCHCGCNYFRAVLSWPDSEGHWWCDTPRFLVEAIAFSARGGLPAGFVVRCGSTLYHYGDWGKYYGPARFVKMIEENPLDGP